MVKKKTLILLGVSGLLLTGCQNPIQTFSSFSPSPDSSSLSSSASFPYSSTASSGATAEPADHFPTPYTPSSSSDSPASSSLSEEPQSSSSVANPDFVFELNRARTGQTLKKYNGSEVNVVVPSSYEGLSVTGIGDDAFLNRSDLLSIVLPTTISSIGIDAFGYCSKIKTIELPSGLTSIDTVAFQYMDALESVSIPDSVTYLGSAAFQNCPLLKSLKLPKGISEIDEGLCYGDASLESLDLSMAKVIETAAFIYCSSLKEVFFSPNLEVINSFAFAGDINLGNITLPSSLRSIEEAAFACCVSMSSFTLGTSNTFLLSEDGRYLSDNFGTLIAVAPQGADWLRIPEGIKRIGNWSISGCVGIKGVIFAKSVTSIAVCGVWGLEKGIYAYTYLTLDMLNSTDWVFANTALYSLEEPAEKSHSYWYFDTDGTTPKLWVFNGN